MDVRWIKYLCILNMLHLAYLLYNFDKKAAIHNAPHETKPGLELNDIHTADVKNIFTVKFHERGLRSLSTSTVHVDHEHKETELIKNKIFWSDLAESFVPKGLSFKESMGLVKNIRSQVVTTFRKGSMDMCGDSQNAIVGLEDGTVMCVRYKREPFVYAEVLAFYLSRLLQMDNVPEVVLAVTNSSSALWRAVNISTLSWENNQTVAMMRRIPDVSSHTFQPEIIREANLKRRVITRNVIRSTKFRNSTDIADIIQWGTLIVFDNLIGHYDRFHFWHKFNKGVFTENLHNSVKSTEGKIWLIDHEQCFFYQYQHRDPTYNFMLLLDIHDKMLKTMCVFQSSLVYGLRALSEQPSPFKTLWNYTLSYEPLLDTMQKDYRFEIFAKLFDKRLAEILQWIQDCTKNEKEDA